MVGCKSRAKAKSVGETVTEWEQVHNAKRYSRVMLVALCYSSFTSICLVETYKVNTHPLLEISSRRQSQLNGDL
jgi:hypothetical protein